jgi:hypothetical protein
VGCAVHSAGQSKEEGGDVAETGDHVSGPAPEDAMSDTALPEDAPYQAPDFQDSVDTSLVDVWPLPIDARVEERDVPEVYDLGDAWSEGGASEADASGALDAADSEDNDLAETTSDAGTSSPPIGYPPLGACDGLGGDSELPQDCGTLPNVWSDWDGVTSTHFAEGKGCPALFMSNVPGWTVRYQDTSGCPITPHGESYVSFGVWNCAPVDAPGDKWSGAFFLGVVQVPLWEPVAEETCLWLNSGKLWYSDVKFQTVAQVEFELRHFDSSPTMPGPRASATSGVARVRLRANPGADVPLCGRVDIRVDGWDLWKPGPFGFAPPFNADLPKYLSFTFGGKPQYPACVVADGSLPPPSCIALGSPQTELASSSAACQQTFYSFISTLTSSESGDDAQP